MNDQQILAVYTQAYNQARQTGGGGQETSHQHAHIAGLRATVALGGGAEGTITMAAAQPVIQPEEPAAAHQRRLAFSSHWLDQAGRRQRIAAQPSFTHVTDAFAAGGLYEYTYLAGDRKVEELIGRMLSEEESAIHGQLSAAVGMQALLDDIQDIVGAETPDELIQTLQTWAAQAQGAPPAIDHEPTRVNEPFISELGPGPYAWCACGYSKTQPFCDGSHMSTEDQPVPFKLKKQTKVKLCQCKQTGTPPYCDETHCEDEPDENTDDTDTQTTA